MLVLTAILMPALLFLLLLVIDVGNWYVHKRHLQMQADAAALAGGAHFGDCFSPDAATVAGANTAIKNAATAYAGNTASTYNFQVGGGAPRVTTLFNSKTFAVGSFVDSSVDIEEPCQTPHLMFDVKQTEADVPYILGSMVDALVPGGTSVVPAINARARVQLHEGADPPGLAAARRPGRRPEARHGDVRERERRGSLAGRPVRAHEGRAGGRPQLLAGPDVGADSRATRTSACGSASAARAARAPRRTASAATGTSVTTTRAPASDSPRSAAWARAGTPTAPTPRVWVTTSCAPSGGPFFVAENLAAPATSCSASVQAVMESATPDRPDGDPAVRRPPSTAATSRTSRSALTNTRRVLVDGLRLRHPRRQRPRERLAPLAVQAGHRRRRDHHVHERPARLQRRRGVVRAR